MTNYNNSRHAPVYRCNGFCLWRLLLCEMVPGLIFQWTCLIQRKKPSMAYYELYPIVMACVLLCQQWSRKRILFHRDKLETVEIINKGHSKINHEVNEKTDFHCSKSSFYYTFATYTWKTGYCSRCYFSFPDGQIPEADIQPTTCLPYHQITMWKKKRLYGLQL